MLLNGGPTDLLGGLVAVPAAGTHIYGPWENRAGAVSAAIRGALEAYGSGGTSINIYVQTSLDKGATWRDVCNFSFTTSAAIREFNISALTPVTSIYTPTDGTITANTCKDGIIGDRWRAKVVVVGTYATSTMRATVDLK